MRKSEKKIVLDIRSDSGITKDLVDDIYKIWNDAGIQNTFNTFLGSSKVTNSVKYFYKYENLKRISSKDYVPTNDDMAQ